MPVQVGDAAPDFALENQDGRTVRLSDFRGRKAVVVFFYPKNHGPICTQEVCSFRDQYEAFTDAGAEVLGISSDDRASHQGFAQTFRLPFALLSDRGGEIRRQWGIPKTLGILPGRVTYVMDRDGIVRHVFSSQLDAESHIRQALGLLQTLPSPESPA